MWISVKDKLPEDDRKVLIVYRGGWKANYRRAHWVRLSRYAGGKWRFLEPAMILAKPERVTHWQDLPDVPENLT